MIKEVRNLQRSSLEQVWKNFKARKERSVSTMFTGRWAPSSVSAVQYSAVRNGDYVAV